MQFVKWFKWKLINAKSTKKRNFSEAAEQNGLNAFKDKRLAARYVTLIVPNAIL